MLLIKHLQEFSTASIFPLPANSTFNAQDAELRHINSSLSLDFIVAALSSTFAELSH